MPKTPGNPAALDPRTARAARAAEIRAERERKARRAKVRNLAVLVGLVVVIGAVALVLAQRGSGKADTSVATPPGISVGSGFSYGTGPVAITVYEDFQCPVCKNLEDTQGASLTALAQQNKATVTYIPISILDNSSAGYSTRAASAAYCVPRANFKAFHDALYANQPEEGGSGLPQSQVLSLVTKAGATGSAVTSCINANTYKDLVGSQTQAVSDRFASFGESQWGTPAVFVDGKWINTDWSQPNYFQQIVAQETAAKASASPSPSAG